MADIMARLMVSIPAEVKKEIDVEKQKEFYDKPYAELYRKIIRLGLDKMREAGASENSVKGWLKTSCLPPEKRTR